MPETLKEPEFLLASGVSSGQAQGQLSSLKQERSSRSQKSFVFLHLCYSRLNSIWDLN